MKSSFPPTLRRLITELHKLPTIGEKSATRLAYHLATQEGEDAVLLAHALQEVSDSICLCSVCFFITERPQDNSDPLCNICRDASRQRDVLCVVEKPADVVALERSGSFRGLYHVIHGLWSPMRGIEPKNLRIAELIKRFIPGKREAIDPLQNESAEVILATSTTVEGDATAMYISSNLEEHGVKTTRIAQGLPKGGELEYADDMTLHISLSRRT